MNKEEKNKARAERKVLFVMASFYPHEDANTNCTDRIVQGLAENGFSVTELTFSQSPDLPTEETRGVVRYLHIYSPAFNRFDRLLRSPVFHRFSALSAVLRVVFAWIEGRVGKWSMRRCFLKKCRELHCADFDCIISGLCPALSHQLAYHACKKYSVPWILYNMDSFVFNTTDKTLRYRKRTEKRWCARAAAVVNTVGLRTHNEQSGYFPYRRLPQLEIPLPNLQIPDMPAPQPKERTNRIRLLYAGSFHDSVRKPDELLRLLRKLDPQTFSAEFYGNCCAYFRAHGTDLPACASLKGNVSAAQCRALTQEADILINVGNDCVNQMPSKVFECIASGKPILHFAGNAQELALPYLQKYPRILCIRSAQDADAESLIRLLQTPQTSAQTLRETYADELSETVCARVADFIQTVIDHTKQ